MMTHLVKLLAQAFLAAQLKYDCPHVKILFHFNLIVGVIVVKLILIIIKLIIR